MKKILVVIMLCIFISSLPGCEKADEALKALDKAKIVKEDIDKKTKDIKDKVIKTFFNPDFIVHENPIIILRAITPPKLLKLQRLQPSNTPALFQ